MATMTRTQLSFVEDLIESCRDCHDICEETIFYAIDKGGDLAQMDVLGVLMDCAGSTGLSKKMIMRGSPYFRRMAPAVIEVCESCAAMCDTVPRDNYFKTCANSARRCANALKRMA